MSRSGRNLGSKYVIVEQCGLGTFGKVFRCVRRAEDAESVVAIKVVRRIERYARSAKIEADILRDVNSRDKRQDSGNVRLLDEFECGGHVCLVFESLDVSVYEFQKANSYRSYPLETIQTVSRDLLRATLFLHDMDLVHTDLKPENVLFLDGAYDERPDEDHPKRPYRVLRSSSAKVIDFGGATYEDERKSHTIQTRQYRAPEVVLGMTWNKSADVWSIACIVMEMFLGDLLFDTHDNDEYLALMDRCIGPMPRFMRARNGKYFRSETNRYDLRYFTTLSTSSRSRSRVASMTSLPDLIDRQLRRWQRRHDSIWTRCETLRNDFVDFVSGMLVYDPKSRWTTARALRHPFCSRTYRGKEVGDQFREGK